MTQHLTPLLNDLAVSVAAPAILLSDPDGQVRLGGVRGWFVDDVRLLDELTVSVLGSDLELVGSDVSGADRQSLHLRRPAARRLAARPAGHARPSPDADALRPGRGDRGRLAGPGGRRARPVRRPGLRPRADGRGAPGPRHRERRGGAARPTVSPGAAATPASGWPSTRPRRTRRGAPRHLDRHRRTGRVVHRPADLRGRRHPGPRARRPAPWGAVAVEAPDTAAAAAGPRRAWPTSAAC